MKLILDVLNTTPEKSYEEWAELTEKKYGKRKKHGYSIMRHTQNNEKGVAFLLSMKDIPPWFKTNLYNLSGKGKGIYTYQPIDIAFLESLYKSEVHSGMPQTVAALKMARYIAKKLNVKVEK